MRRDEFFEKAKKHGWKHRKKMTVQGRQKLREELLAFYKSPEGQAEIAKAPPWHREASVEVIVDALLEEVD